MAEYWQKGSKCCGYHELFFNGLFVVLYRGLGNKAKGILNNVKSYYAYHFERLYVINKEDLKEYNIVCLEPGLIDEISYATFPNRKSAEMTLAKNGKKPGKCAK